jgi:hypothetical protein
MSSFVPMVRELRYGIDERLKGICLPDERSVPSALK